MKKSRGGTLVCSVVILVYLVYHFDLLCALRSGEISLESSGKQENFIAIHNSCKKKMHGMSLEGIHVIGLGKLRAESEHVGLIEDFNRVEKLKEIDRKLKIMASKFRYVGLVTNGGTHKKPALTRIRDDLALEILGGFSGEEFSGEEFSLQKFFKTYDMGKFLSVEHGCCKPYIMVYDVTSGVKVVERVGKLDDKIKHVLKT